MIAEDQGCFGAELFVDDSRFLVHHTNFVALGYYFAGASNKPFLASLVGPSGRNMIDPQPSDHAHHRGIWWGHGDVNGVDYYLEVPSAVPDADGEGGKPLGSIVHVGFDEIIDDSPRFGFVEQLEWHEPAGTVAIREQRRLSVDFSRNERYELDLASTYTAAVDLAFGDTKESTLPGIRLAEPLTVSAGGRMVNSRGGVAEAECFGNEAEWVDHCTSRPGLYWKTYTEGLAIFDHPDNPYHPTVWFARDYGVQSPFEGHHFIGAGTMAAGDELTLRHRILVHEGDTESADIAGAYAEYAGEDRTGGAG